MVKNTQSQAKHNDSKRVMATAAANETSASSGHKASLATSAKASGVSTPDERVESDTNRGGEKPSGGSMALKSSCIHGKEKSQMSGKDPAGEPETGGGSPVAKQSVLQAMASSRSRRGLGVSSDASTARVLGAEVARINPAGAQSKPHLSGKGNVVVTPELPASAMSDPLNGKRKRKENMISQDEDEQNSGHRQGKVARLPDAVESSTAMCDNSRGSSNSNNSSSTVESDHPQNVEDAIAGLFMMTQTPPKAKTETTNEGMASKKDHRSDVAPDDAVAGLIMMTKSPPSPLSQTSGPAAVLGAPYMPPPHHPPPFPMPYYPPPPAAHYAMAHHHYAAYRAMASASAAAVAAAAARNQAYQPKQAPKSIQPTPLVLPPNKVAAKGIPGNSSSTSTRVATLSTAECDAIARKRGKFTCHEQSTWAMRFRQAVEFKEKHGHCRIPYQYPFNKDLARWAKRQKYQYKLFIGEAEAFEKKSSLTKERIAALENIGFCFDAQQESWNEQFDALVEYVRKYGHAKVAKRERSLGRWVCSQRTRISQGKMTLDRFICLEACKFVWASQTPTQNFIAQIEKMREKALKKLQTDPETRKRFSEIQAKVSQGANKNKYKSVDNIQQVPWGSLLARTANPSVASAGSHVTLSPGTLNSSPVAAASLAPLPTSVTAPSPVSLVAPVASIAPTGAPTDLPKDPPLKTSENSSLQASSVNGENKSDTPLEPAKSSAATTIDEAAKETNAEHGATPTASVGKTEEGIPCIALSMKSAASIMEANAQKADLVSKDLLRAKAAALRAAAVEIEAIANASSSSSSDVNYAQV